MWEFRDDDLSGETTRSFVAAHLDQMHSQSPPESVHALGIAALNGPDVLLITAWRDGVLGGMGAYRRMGDGGAELKSMRTADDVRGQGLGRMLLHRLIESARAEGITTLWLETGSTDPFIAARGLYVSEGFAECGPFGAYREDPESSFYRRDI